MSSGELKNKVALITGSTNGIGRDTAKLFAAEGAHVIVSGRDSERGRLTVEAIEADGGVARFIQADLGDLPSLRRLAVEVRDVDVLINNAAFAVTGSTFDQDVESYEASFDVNVRAPYFLTQALVPTMIAKGSGSVVNISTMAASIAMPGMTVYSATKAALNSLTRTWAAEFGSSGVRVNTVAAGPTRTDNVIEHLGEEMAQQIGATTLLGRLASTSEIAQVVLFLASDRSSYLTGATVAADAGRTAA